MNITTNTTTLIMLIILDSHTGTVYIINNIILKYLHRLIKF